MTELERVDCIAGAVIPLVAIAFLMWLIGYPGITMFILVVGGGINYLLLIWAIYQAEKKQDEQQ